MHINGDSNSHITHNQPTEVNDSTLHQCSTCAVCNTKIIKDSAQQILSYCNVSDEPSLGL